MWVEDVRALSFVDPWFLDQIEELVAIEDETVVAGIDALDARRLRALKRKGFSDARLATLVGTGESAVRALRKAFRSDERRAGKECVRTCRYRWSQSH